MRIYDFASNGGHITQSDLDCMLWI